MRLRLAPSIVRQRNSRFLHCWVLPYLRSRVSPGFRPIVGCVYTEWKCNLECGYCRSHDNRAGMDDATADRVIDWLHAAGCRVIGVMGGEPLVRAAFVTRFVAAAAARGFYVSLPTNGRLLTPNVIDRLGHAGIATVNLSVDCVTEKPGLPKALAPVRSHFEYLVKSQARFGHTVLISIAVTRDNLEDVRTLTEFSRDHGVATVYHLCESPEPGGHFRAEDLAPAADLLDYLIDRKRAGFAMINSVRHLRAMKRLLGGGLDPWPCRAGRNMVVCRTDGTLAPCYPLESTGRQWGAVGCPRFGSRQLRAMTETCSRSCYSTVGYAVANYYDARQVWGAAVQWGMERFRAGEHRAAEEEPSAAAKDTP